MNKTSLSRIANDVLSKPNGRFQSRIASRVNPVNTFKQKYSGPFKISSEVNDSIYTIIVASGVVFLGSGNVEIDASVITLNNDTYNITEEGTYYIYLVMYSRKVVGGETVYWEYRASQTLPKIQEEIIEGGNRWVYPFVIGTAVVETEEIPAEEEDGDPTTNFVVTSTTQWQWGPHYVSGVLS